MNRLILNTEAKSGVDYRDLPCSSAPAAKTQEAQPIVKPLQLSSGFNSGLLKTVNTTYTGALLKSSNRTAEIVNDILRGQRLQSPLNGLTKLLNPYNLFG